MKKIFILFIALSINFICDAQRIPTLPKATSLVDTDYVVINKSDSVITKIIQAKYFKASTVKDTTPSTGNTVVITKGYSVLAVHGTGTISALTITFPSSPVNGQVFTLTTDQAISTLTMTGGTSVYSPGSVSVQAANSWVYDALYSKWFRR